MKYLTQKDIEPGGDYFELREKLEEVARNLDADSFEVIPGDEFLGPICKMKKKIMGQEIIAKMNWDDETGLLFLKNDDKKISFYQDEADFFVWRRIVS